MQSEVDQPAWRVRITEELCGRVRQEHLPAMPGGADPRAAVHADADVALFRRDRRRAVDSHPYAQLASVRPLVRCQHPLGVDGRARGIRRAWECHEERVSLRIHLRPTGSGNAFADQPSVFVEHDAVPLRTEVAQQPGRALDVGEEKRDCPAGALRHAGERSPLRRT